MNYNQKLVMEAYTEMNESHPVLMKEEVMPELLQYLSNKERTLEEVKVWAMKMKLDEVDLNRMILDMASTTAKLITGGRSNQVENVSFDPEELDMGTEIELEHTVDRNIATKIARDHLAELPDYYTRLSNMEANARAASIKKESDIY